MAAAWRWFSSARRDAEDTKREVSSREVKTQTDPVTSPSLSLTQLGFPLVLQLEAKRLQLLVRLLSEDVERPPVSLLQSVNLLSLLLFQTLLQGLMENKEDT